MSGRATVATAGTREDVRGARYWLDPSDARAILPRDSGPRGLGTLAESRSCHPRAIVRRFALSTAAESRSPVRPVDAMNPPNGREYVTGDSDALATPWSVFQTASARIIPLATCYAAAIPSYLAIHARIRRERGPASARACWRCGRRARVWSCIAGPADRIRGVSGSGAPAWYSLTLDDYRPACSRCAAADDRDHLDARRAVAHLALSPIPKPHRRETAPPPSPPDRGPALFDPDPTTSTGWSITP